MSTAAFAKHAQHQILQWTCALAFGVELLYKSTGREANEKGAVANYRLGCRNDDERKATLEGG
jgi:hypothetical protein